MPKGHYDRSKRRTRPPGKAKFPYLKNATLAERFWQKVDKEGPFAPNGLGRCWQWIGSRKDSYPYWHGQIWDGKKPAPVGHALTSARGARLDRREGPLAARPMTCHQPWTESHDHHHHR